MPTIKPIQSGDIHLWQCQPDQINDSELLLSYKNLLTEDELTRQQRYRFPKDQHNALITRAFIRYVLSQYADISPQDWRFIKGEKDKPEIANSSLLLPLRFNLSHTDGLIICAITLDDDIGCDIENTTRDNDVLAIADRYFSPSEIRALFSLPTDQQRSRFFDYWTLKESYIKAWGLGLAIPLNDFSFHITPSTHNINQDIRLSFAPHRIDHPELWHSWLIDVSKQYRMAISIKSTAHKTHHLHFYNCIPLVEINHGWSELNTTPSN